MRDLASLDGDVVELDGRGRCAIPGLVDCHTHPAFGGDRVDEFSLRAGGASYEELHAAGGGILSTVRATRAAGEDGLRAAVEPASRVDARAGHDDVRGEVGLRARPRHRARVAARGARSGRDPDLARRARGAAGVRGRRRRVSRLRARARCCPRRRRSPRPPTCSSSAARSTPRRRAATSRRAATAGPRAAPARRPVHGVGRDPARDRARRALGRPSRGDRRRGRACARGERRRRRRAAGERALPRPADAAGARARRRRRGRRARDRLQPGQRLLREPAALLLARRDAAEALAGGGARPRARSTRRTCSAAPARSGGSLPATAPTSSCSTRPTGATSPTTSAAGSSPTWSRGGRRARLARMPSRKQRRRELKQKRHEYEFVYVDGEGNELEELPEGFEESRRRSGPPHGTAPSPPRSEGPAAARGASGRTPPVPSWNRALKRGGLLGVVVFVLFSLTAKGHWASVLPLRCALHRCSSFRSRT